MRPLGLAAVPCAVITRPGSPAAFNRFARRVLYWEDFETAGGKLVERLIEFAEAQPERPVLFFENDAQLLLFSRNRDKLAPWFHLPLAAPGLIEDLADKERFAGLAARLGLPVPRTRVVQPSMEPPPEHELTGPAILKPLRRVPAWDAIAGPFKALRLPTCRSLQDLWPGLATAGGR